MVPADILLHRKNCIKVCKDAEIGDYGALVVDYWLGVNKSKQQLFSNSKQQLRFQYDFKLTNLLSIDISQLCHQESFKRVFLHVHTKSTPHSAIVQFRYHMIQIICIMNITCGN